MDDDTLGRARIYVESSEAAMHESGDVIAAGQVFAEIGEVVAGVQPGRTSQDEITLFKSVGVTIEDIVAADLVYRKALSAQGGSGLSRLTREGRWGSAPPRGSHTV